MDYDVIIIGAGLGGLVCGALLARKGLRVAVFEKKARVGGCCTSFAQGLYVRPLRPIHRGVSGGGEGMEAAR